MRKISDVVDNEVVKNTKFNTLVKKVNNIDPKIPGGTTLIHISQCNTDKQNLEKKIGDVGNIIPDTSGLVTTTALNAKLGEVENKILNTNSLVTTTVLNTKISEVENKIPELGKYIITTQEFNKLPPAHFKVRL